MICYVCAASAERVVRLWCVLSHVFHGGVDTALTAHSYAGWSCTRQTRAWLICWSWWSACPFSALPQGPHTRGRPPLGSLRMLRRGSGV